MNQWNHNKLLKISDIAIAMVFDMQINAGKTVAVVIEKDT